MLMVDTNMPYLNVEKKCKLIIHKPIVYLFIYAYIWKNPQNQTDFVYFFYFPYILNLFDLVQYKRNYKM